MYIIINTLHYESLKNIPQETYNKYWLHKVFQNNFLERQQCITSF